MRFVIPNHCQRCKGLLVKHKDELARPQATCINCGRDAVNYALPAEEAEKIEIAERSLVSLMNTRWQHRKLRERIT